jgi:hypothetical protein
MRGNRAGNGYPPPFAAGTPQYAHWYQSIVAKAKKEGATDWSTYYARAKAEAMAKPPAPPNIRRHQRGLFGGSYTREYQAWRYRTLQACRAAGEDWPTFFAKAKAVEMRRQGLIPTTVVPFNPSRTQSLAFVPPSPAMTPQDGRLMFDFSVDNNAPEERDWR